MTSGELGDSLEQTGYPVVYHHWESPPKLPYIVYLYTDADNFGADDKVYSKFDNYQIELYSDRKDVQAENKLEEVLDSADLFYDKSEMYIESEKLYEVLYEIQI